MKNKAKCVLIAKHEVWYSTYVCFAVGIISFYLLYIFGQNGPESCNKMMLLMKIKRTHFS